ncbi:hypothetical protein AB7952_02390 [Streptomyces sp. PG2]
MPSRRKVPLALVERRLLTALRRKPRRNSVSSWSLAEEGSGVS